MEVIVIERIKHFFRKMECHIDGHYFKGKMHHNSEDNIYQHEYREKCERCGGIRVQEICLRKIWIGDVGYWSYWYIKETGKRIW
ncbi:hypothetical protein EEL30_21610 [Brevibacillus laterosporus]|uniref:Uncharacterized protein n=1 Tax=Brevibacillus laterosporus TaxID=1465 RepID=A0A518VCC6_BRELA|nr:hypothetical protein EEL30_21610 [Brevibacillus laterosporus]